MKKFLLAGVITSALAAPLLASAQTFIIILQRLGQLVNTAIPIALALGFLAFFWGLALFIFSVGNEEGRKQGGKIMLWGIIAIFVIVTISGLVTLIQTSFGITGGSQNVTAPIIN